MSTKFSENIIPISGLKVNLGRAARHISGSRRPVLLTSSGRDIAVIQSIADYEKSEEERAFMRAVAMGLADPEEGREISFCEAKVRLGLE